MVNVYRFITLFLLFLLKVTDMAEQLSTSSACKKSGLTHACNPQITLQYYYVSRNPPKTDLTLKRMFTPLTSGMQHCLINYLPGMERMFR